MAYTVQTWNAGDPITKAKMDHIESGIASAATTADGALNSNSQTILDMQSGISDLSSAQSALSTQLTAISGSYGTIRDYATQAYSWLINATTSHTPSYETLEERFRMDEDNISTARGMAETAQAWIKAARDKHGQVYDVVSGQMKNPETLSDRISDIYYTIDTVNITATDAMSALVPTNGMRPLVDRVNSLDGGGGANAPTRTIQSLITEINNAHRNSSDTLDGRFDSIDGGSAPSRTLPDIITEVNGAHRDGVTDDTLDKRLDDIDNVGSDQNQTHKYRITQLETEMSNARSGATDLDARLDGIDTAVDGKVAKTDIKKNLTYATDDNTVLQALQGKLLKDDIDAINDKIGDGFDSTNTIVDRIDAIDNVSTGTVAGLDTRLSAVETEIGTLSSSRIDALETEITNAHSSSTSSASYDSIDARFEAIEAVANAAAVKATVDASIEDLDARLDAIDNGSALTGNTLVSRVTTLEGKDTIVIDTPASGSNYTEGIPNISSPSTTADYLIADDEGKYFYWRYFQTGMNPDTYEWQLVGGAGGSGNGSSSGIILSELPAEGDVNTDYFIGTDALGYTHYRFVEGTNGATGHYIKILPNNLINDLSVDQYGGLVAHNIGDNQTNLLADFYALKGVTYTPNYDPQDPNTLISQTLQFTGTNGETIDPIVIVGGGGGGGTVYSVNIESPTPASRSIPTTNTDPVTIQAKVVMKQGNELLGSGATATGQIQYRQYGTTTWQNGDQIEVDTVDPALKYVIQNNTYFTVDVSKYLVDDKTMQIRLAIVALPGGEGTEVTRYQTFNISKVNISIVAEPFDYARVMNSNFQFNYRCFGTGIAKTVHFLIDGTDAVTPVSTTSNNTVLQQVIPMTGKANGMHTFQVYFVTSTGLESNKLNYFILYNTDNTRQAPLIGAAAENTSIVDGDEIIVNYSVNTIGTEKTDRVEIELYTLDTNNNKQIRSTTILTNITNNTLASPPYRTFDYPSLRKANASDPDPDPITVYVKLTAFHTVTVNEEDVELSDSQTIAIQVRYLNTNYNLSAEINNLLFEYNAYGRSNNDAGKETYTYTYNKVNGQSINFTGTFNNFNWSTDGYVDGESLIIGGGATLDINVPIFNSRFDNISIEENEGIDKITTNGRTIEIDYQVLSTTNLGATIIDCMTTGVNPKGFKVTPQNCYLLNSGSNIDIDETGFIKNEENVAAAYLNPGSRTHLTFVIEPISSTLAADGTYHQSTNIYVNGEFANACPYNTVGNDFENNATISIGSDTCLIKLYSIKLYNRGLTEEKVLHNYAVAPVATRDKISRLEDNDVLNDNGEVDYEKARKKYTCLLLTGMGTVNGNVVPTMAPYKGYPSVVGRQKDGETVGKTESGLLLTKPTTENSNGYSVEFDLQDRMIDPNNLYGYASSNNVQGTSSQKFPVKNLKVYLAKGDDESQMVFDETETISVKKVYKYSINTAATAAYTSVYGSNVSLPTYIAECGANIATTVKNLSDVPTQEELVTIITDYLTAQDAEVGAAYVSPGDELITHPTIAYKKSKKVKYALRENGLGESTLCWKADYMSTDHANTFNANIAGALYGTEDRLSDRWTDQTQFTVYGIKCLLFQQSGDGQPVFVGDGCLNNDKGNHKTFGLETSGDTEDGDTMCQKWDFRNNTGSLLYFKHDGLFETIDGKPAISRELECIYPDEGDLADIGVTPNYNHFQILSSWLGNRANYWYESDTSTRATKKQIFIDEFTNHFNMNHILIYYLFMEYTALCDNRVKNIHMRTDNAGEERIKIAGSNEYYFEGNSNPNSGPWTLAENLETRIMQEPIMDENGDYQFDQNGNMELGNVSHVFVKDSVINNIDWQQGEGHSNFAIWAPVLYDLDSCFSADNVGYLKIRYDADWDYSLYNKLKFAGFDSILWLQVEDCFQDELKVMAKRLYNRVVGLNYSTFYRQQITDNLASLCPAITNQDMILKYEKPWTEGFLDYSQDVLNPPTSTDKYKYLQRGTRTGQKAIFMKQRSLFLASKYDGNEFIQDKITFRAGTQVNHDNSILTLVANQKLYPGAQFGDVNDTTKVTRRPNKVYDATQEDWVDIGEEGWVPELTPCQIQHSGNMNNTDGIEIYGASVLNDIGDISRFHPWQLKVGNAVNLKKLILGSTTPGYQNVTTDDIDGLNSCTLLEEINVCNLKNLTSLQLGNNGFIKKVYATGSGLNTLALPRGGILDTIAYGENTTDITIINHGRLTNFSYENSSTNHYANVTRLWIENTPNVPVKDIITARLTPLTSNDKGLRAGGLRIIGINLDLGDDVSFLQLLASDLVKGAYLSSSGSHIEGNTQSPEITGTIRVNRIRASLYNTLKSMYPNLTINYNRKDDEFTVTYYNYDGTTVLFIDHGISEDRVKDPAYDTDLITNKPYLYSKFPETNGIPTKPDDVEYSYKFGLYDNQNKYRRFTGWVRKGTNINPTNDTMITGTLDYVAVYPEASRTKKQYTVSWYADHNTSEPLLSYTEDYGTPIGTFSQPEELGIFQRTRNVGNRVEVFKGWDRPVGKLTGDINVYAQWESSAINDDTETIVMNTLTAADVWALASVVSNSRKDTLLRDGDHLGEPIMIKMGHEFDYETGAIVANLIGGTEPRKFEGGTDEVIIPLINNEPICPLSTNSDWTIAIDYKFLMNTAQSFSNGREFVLASCYQNANSSIQGFKLSLIPNATVSETTHTIQVSWGTQTLTIDYATTDNTSGIDDRLFFTSYRNMVVLAHNADNPTQLQVFYNAPNTTNSNAPMGADYNIGISTETLTWANAALINAPIILGGNYSGTTTNIENSNIYRKPAQGIIYWAKYWSVDLGEKNCAMLAAWPHETIPFYLSGYNGANSPVEQIYENSQLSFVAAQGVGDKYVYSTKSGSTDSDGYTGWKVSRMRSICNNLIYKGMPIAYQSIIRQSAVNSSGLYIVNSAGTQTIITTNDYLFLPAEREINHNTSGQNVTYGEVQTIWVSPWHWMVLSEINNVYGLVSGTASNLEIKNITGEDGYRYYRYRFSGHYIKPTARIFITTTNPATRSWTYNSATINVQSGDVWIDSGNVAYMYFTNDDISNGEKVDAVVTNGGWKRADIWHLRSYHTTGVPQASENLFEKVGYKGELILGPTQSVEIAEGRLLCPEFTV